MFIANILVLWGNISNIEHQIIVGENFNSIYREGKFNQLTDRIENELFDTKILKSDTWRYRRLFCPLCACYFLMVIKVDIGHHPAVWRLIIMALSDNIIII